MVKKRSEDSRLKQVMETERRDADPSRVTNWCKHIRVERTSQGLIGGMKSVSCSYFHGPDGPSLDMVAGFFIGANCPDCPHHAEVSPNNIGRAIVEHAKQAKEETNPVTEAQTKLAALIPVTPETALAKEADNDRAIIDLIAALSTKDQTDEIVKRLEIAASLFPDAFTEDAIVLLGGFSADASLNGPAWDVIATVVAKNDKALAWILPIAEHCFNHGLAFDAAAGTIGSAISQGTRSIDDRTRRKCISFLGTPFMYRYRGDGVRAALQAIVAKEGISELERILIEKLRDSNRDVRVGACAAVKIVIFSQKDYAGTALVDPLLESLVLDDNPYGESADGAAQSTLAALAPRNPDLCSRLLARTQIETNEEVQELVAGILERVARETPAVVAPLLPDIFRLARDRRLTVKVRGAIAEIAEAVSRKDPSLMLPHLDRVLGEIALAVQEQQDEDKTKKPAPKDFLAALQATSDAELEKAVLRSLQQAVEHGASANPSKAADDLLSLLDAAIQNGNFDFGNRIFSILTAVAGSHAELCGLRICAGVLPYAKHSNVYVRCNVLYTFEGVLRYREVTLSSEMVDAVMASLEDEYIGPIQAGIEVLTRVDLAEPQKTNAVNRLFILGQTFAKEKPKLAWKTLICLRRFVGTDDDFSRVLQRVFQPLLLVKDRYLRQEIVSDLKHIQSDSGLKMWIELVCAYYVEFGILAREGFQTVSTGQEEDTFFHLFQIKRSILSTRPKLLLDTSKAITDPWTKTYFSELLSHIRKYKEASAAFGDAAQSVPNEPRFRPQKDWFSLLSTVATSCQSVEDGAGYDKKEWDKILSAFNKLVAAGKAPSITVYRDQLTIAYKLQALWTDIADRGTNGLSIEHLNHRAEELRLSIEGLITQSTDGLLDQYLAHFRSLSILLGVVPLVFRWTEARLKATEDPAPVAGAIREQLAQAEGQMPLAELDRLFAALQSMKAELAGGTGAASILGSFRLLAAAEVPFYFVRDSSKSPLRSRLRDGNAASEAQDAFAIRADLYVSDSLVRSNLLLVGQRVAPCKISLAIPQWPDNVDRLELEWSHSYGANNLKFPKVVISEKQEFPTIDGNIEVGPAQTAGSAPIAVECKASFITNAGKKISLLVLGTPRTQVRILDQERFRSELAPVTQAVQMMLVEIDKKIPQSKNAVRSEIEEALNALLQYAQFNLQDAVWTGADHDEKEFQGDLFRFLSYTSKQRAFREVKAGRGFQDILVANVVPVELKCAKDVADRDKLVGAHIGQVAEYVIAQGQSVGILYVLDLTPTLKVSPDIRDDVSFHVVPKELMRGSAVAHQPMVIAIFVRGNQPKPSSIVATHRVRPATATSGPAKGPRKSKAKSKKK